MRVRLIDSEKDWSYGRGVNDYKKDLACIAQQINCRLSEFLGDCFFNLGAGIDWFNLLGAKDQLALTLAINSVLLNTNGVTGVRELFVDLNEERLLTVSYQVQTIFSTTAGIFEYDLNAIQ